jgi:pimeloyl-ACP methyl ester carboxylesterase
MSCPPSQIHVCSICGDTDPVYPAVRATASKIPNARLEIIPGRNHVETLSRSDLVVPPILDFLRNAPPS